MKNNLNVKTLPKNELRDLLENSLSLTIEMNDLVSKRRKATKISWYVFAYPFLLVIALLSLDSLGVKIPYTNPLFYLMLLLIWVLLVIYQIPKITLKLNKLNKRKVKIEKTFMETTGMHRKLCNVGKIGFMIKALDDGVANNYKEALAYADICHHELLVDAHRKFIK